MAKAKTVYFCTECGADSPKWMGQCPGCKAWNTLVEEVIKEVKNTRAKGIDRPVPVSLSHIEMNEDERMDTQIQELNRVLGGGIVPGSLALVGGDPGIGKSTLLLQMACSIGKSYDLLYVSGEESLKQIKMRADRLNINEPRIQLLSEINMDVIEDIIRQKKPHVVVIDSIQTMFAEEIASAPGSVSQVREVTSKLLRLTKETGICVFIVGHVTKEGAIAGPRVLEHMVDTVLYFEGERSQTYRILRAVKNRFGSTNEIGIFEMTDKGLIEVTNPSEFMLEGRPLDSPGSTVTCSIEGTRPLLIEIQSLVSQTNYGIPRRTAIGTDYNRVMLLMAVLEKRAGLQLGSCDSYVNITGGIKVTEPAMDLAIAISLASSFKNKTVNPHMAIIGEVGLTGEIRGVSMLDKRLMELKKMGFKQCMIPAANALKLSVQDIEIIPVSHIGEALQILR